MNTKRPLTPPELMSAFIQLQIEIETHTHAPVATAAEADLICDNIPGAHCKNLFVKNKRGDYYLITMLAHQRLDLKKTSDLLDAPRFSFASDERLMEKLGVTPGSVTPFAVINDHHQDVHVILDHDMMQHDILNFHPLRNDMTCSIHQQDLLKFFKHTGHTPRMLTLPKREPQT